MIICWCSRCGELDYAADGAAVDLFIGMHGHGVVRVARDIDFDDIRDFLEEAAVAHPWPETLR